MWNVLPVRANMDCWHCGTKLIWGSDHDIEDENEDYIMETNLSCPACNSLIIVYLPKEKNHELIRN